MKIEQLLAELTIEEKAALLSGTRFMETNPIPRLGIPGLVMADGPHGLRKQIGTADNGVSRSEPATAFPTAATVASSWNVENARRMGAAIAGECLYYGVNILLGPGVNIKRNPRCGRNFEYYSEDPLLTGVFGTAFTQGVQSRKVGVSVKHFAANNAENYRFMGESVVDERALREIYLRAYERIVRQAKPYTMMCAYNRLWGRFCSENRRLLTDILRDEWGFDGAVMTDWGAARDRIEGVKAGLDLEMPGDTAYCRKAIIDGARDGSLPMADLDRAVGNMLALIGRCGEQERPESIDREGHHALAAEVAKDSAVLLQNGGLLPLDTGRRLLFVGDLFSKMRYQGAGSSMISPALLTTPRDAFDARGVAYAFSRGYAENATEPDPALLAALGREVENCEAVVFFGGLTDYVESEGGDRPDLRLPQNQLAAMDVLVKSGKPVAVVLFGGAPVELPFAEEVDAVLNMYLPGQNGGEATAALLLGEENPSGKLAESWPLRYGDVPFGEEYSTGEIELYRESVFVGYRYYTTAGKPVRYPFGHGLSYTRFSYSNLEISRENGVVTASCEVANTGGADGAEVVQLYVQSPRGALPLPLRELRAFEKLYLKAGEKRRATLTFAEEELSVYDAAQKRWVLQSGPYTAEVGASCEDIRLSGEWRVPGEDAAAPLPPNAAAAYADLADFRVDDAAFEALVGRPLPKAPPPLPLRMESIFSDFNRTFWGRVLFGAVLGVANKQKRQALRLPPGAERDNRLKGAMFLHRILSSNSPRTFSMSAGSQLPYNIARAFVEIGNGHLLRGLRHICTKIKVPPLPWQTEEKGGNKS